MPEKAALTGGPFFLANPKSGLPLSSAEQAPLPHELHAFDLNRVDFNLF